MFQIEKHRGAFLSIVLVASLTLWFKLLSYSNTAITTKNIAKRAVSQAKGHIWEQSDLSDVPIDGGRF